MKVDFEGSRIVYAIVHNPTGKIYIGSSERGAWRAKDHLRLLRIGKHKNKAMQEDFDKYGDDYSVYLLDVIPTNLQSDREYLWMAYFQTYDPDKGYNFEDPKSKHLPIQEFPKLNIEDTEPVPQNLMSCAEKLSRYWDIPIEEILALRPTKGYEKCQS